MSRHSCYLYDIMDHDFFYNFDFTFWLVLKETAFFMKLKWEVESKTTQNYIKSLVKSQWENLFSFVAD